jgi:hypothetical protein
MKYNLLNKLLDGLCFGIGLCSGIYIFITVAI